MAWRRPCRCTRAWSVVQRLRSDLGLYVHLHCLVTDGAYEEQNDGEQRFLAAPPPTPERMTAVLAQVHEVVRAADDDLDPGPRWPPACSSRSPARAPRPTHRPRLRHESPRRRAQAGDRLDHGAVQPGRRARAGQRKHAAQLARQRTLTPALRRQPVAQFQGNVSGGCSTTPCSCSARAAGATRCASTPTG